MSPVFGKETMEMIGMDSVHGVSASATEKACLTAVYRNNNGDTLDVRDFV
jgi:hypothetical protein